MPTPPPRPAAPQQLGLGLDFDVHRDRKLDLSQPREGQSYFCLHNPALNSFALSGPEEMAATIMFAVASQLKDWGTIYTYYPYLVQYLKDGGRVDRYDKKDVGDMGVLLFPHNKNIQKMWDARAEIFSTVKRLYGNDLELFKYLRSLPGLGVIKAGFAIQLIAGKFGCIDSINSYFYGSEAPKTTTNSDKKQAEYVGYLNNLEATLKDPISKRLWDDWCDIVAHKIRNTNGNGQKALEVTLHNGTQRIQSYAPTALNKNYYGIGKQKTGHDVSFEHGEAITNAFANSSDFKLSHLKEGLRQAIAGSLALLREQLESTDEVKGQPGSDNPYGRQEPEALPGQKTLSRERMAVPNAFKGKTSFPEELLRRVCQEFCEKLKHRIFTDEGFDTFYSQLVGRFAPPRNENAARDFVWHIANRMPERGAAKANEWDGDEDAYTRYTPGKINGLHRGNNWPVPLAFKGKTNFPITLLRRVCQDLCEATKDKAFHPKAFEALYFRLYQRFGPPRDEQEARNCVLQIVLGMPEKQGTDQAKTGNAPDNLLREQLDSPGLPEHDWTELRAMSRNKNFAPDFGVNTLNQAFDAGNPARDGGSRDEPLTKQIRKAIPLLRYWNFIVTPREGKSVDVVYKHDNYHNNDVLWVQRIDMGEDYAQDPASNGESVYYVLDVKLHFPQNDPREKQKITSLHLDDVTNATLPAALKEINDTLVSFFGEYRKATGLSPFGDTSQLNEHQNKEGLRRAIAGSLALLREQLEETKPTKTPKSLNPGDLPVYTNFAGPDGDYHLVVDQDEEGDRRARYFCNGAPIDEQAYEQAHREAKVLHGQHWATPYAFKGKSVFPVELLRRVCQQMVEKIPHKVFNEDVFGEGYVEQLRLYGTPQSEYHAQNIVVKIAQSMPSR